LGKQSILSVIGAAAYAILLLAAATPLVPFALCFVMAPLILITAREELRRVPLFVLPAMAVAYFLSGPLGAFTLLVALFFLPSGLAMGVLYRRQAPARTVVTVGAVTLLGVMLLWLLILNSMGQNLISKFRDLMHQYYQAALPLMQGVVPASNEQDYLNMIIGSLPYLLIFISLFLTFVAHGLGRWLLGKSGMEASRFKPLREWMLPKSFVVIYIIVLVTGLFVAFNNKSVLSMLVTNLSPLLLLAFCVQAISFLFYLSHVNGWGRLLPILGIVVLVLFPPANFIFSFLGLLDAVFPIRERLRKKN
jgi:uncharacterized protein YybS (DUF2232 family)